jgi:hypothetical protein
LGRSVPDFALDNENLFLSLVLSLLNSPHPSPLLGMYFASVKILHFARSRDAAFFLQGGPPRNCLFSLLLQVTLACTPPYIEKTKLEGIAQWRR